jgi:hypothetical protein
MDELAIRRSGLLQPNGAIWPTRCATWSAVLEESRVLLLDLSVAADESVVADRR